MNPAFYTIVTAAGSVLVALLAARWRSERIAVLGLLGGHALLLAFATQADGRASLAAGLFVLTAVMLALSVRCSFRLVELLASAGVACYFPVFVVFRPESWGPVVGVSVATAYFAVLALAYTLGALRDGTATSTRLVLVALATIGYGFALAAALGEVGPAYGWMLVVLAAVLFATACIRALPRRLSSAYLYLGFAALTVALGSLLDALPLVDALIVEAALLVAAGKPRADRWLLAAGGVLFVFTAYALLRGALTEPTPVLGARTLAVAIYAVALGFVFWRLRGSK